LRKNALHYVESALGQFEVSGGELDETTVGAAAFAGVVYLLYGDVANAADAALSDVEMSLYRTLRNFVIVYLDVVTKVGFGTIALHADRALADTHSSGRRDELVTTINSGGVLQLIQAIVSNGQYPSRPPSWA
jgi:hypothetical protein